MNLNEIMLALEENGSEQTKKIFKNHGAQEPFFGVKVAFLKTIQRKVKTNYKLSMELYATGNSDAMYLAGLIADPKQMTKADLQLWAEGAYWYMISDYTLAQTAANSNFGLELALEWMDSNVEFKESAGWVCLSHLMKQLPLDGLPLDKIEDQVDFVHKGIHMAKNRVRYSMNGFLIAVGSYVPELSKKAVEAAQEIGKVQVDMGGTACKVPFAPDYIQKSVQKGSLEKYGKARK